MMQQMRLTYLMSSTTSSEFLVLNPTLLEFFMDNERKKWRCFEMFYKTFNIVHVTSKTLTVFVKYEFEHKQTDNPTNRIDEYFQLC